MRTQYKNPAIHKAFKVLETLSAEEETRLRVEAREKALKNAASELAAAREEGREEGLNKGELIGEIRATQRFLKHPVIPLEELTSKSQQELTTILRQLEAKLN
jgi:flagellar biosynthesis/type III secretory pathway protein FliH